MCGQVKELTPHNAPAPLGNHEVTIRYHDENLFHDVITGRSVSGVLHVLNNAPIDWCSKKQFTVETATCGLEYSSTLPVWNRAYAFA